MAHHNSNILRDSAVVSAGIVNFRTLDVSRKEAVKQMKKYLAKWLDVQNFNHKRCIISSKKI
eukprot:5586459-Karenia_brevis.AAC.1